MNDNVVKVTLISVATFVGLFVTYYIVANQSGSKTLGIGEKASCDRAIPYTMAPEFERALSLRKQRIQESEIPVFSTVDLEYGNCLSIQFADLTDRQLDGIFLFDENSTIDNLRIYVDKTFKLNDDLLTAVLFSHELTHVNQFITYKRTGIKPDCVAAERDAFLQQLYFIKILNNEEINSLLARWKSFDDGTIKNSSSLSSLTTLEELFKLSIKSSSQCSNQYGQQSPEWSMCVRTTEEQEIEGMIRGKEGYQKQCHL